MAVVVVSRCAGATGDFYRGRDIQSRPDRSNLITGVVYVDADANVEIIVAVVVVVIPGTIAVDDLGTA